MTFQEAFLDELEAISEKRAGLLGSAKPAWPSWMKSNILMPVASTAIMAVIADKAIRATDALAALVRRKKEKKKKKGKKK